LHHIRACRRKRKWHPNAKAHNGRTGEGESVLPDRERKAAREETHDNCAERTCSSLICVDPRYHADEKWERIDSKWWKARSQRPCHGAITMIIVGILLNIVG
jgi:hypothetical protein